MAATRELLFHENYAEGKYAASVMCNIEFDPDTGRVELISEFACKSPEGGEKFSIRHKGMVNNPIELAVIATWLTSKYAICVGGKFLADTSKEMLLAYGESREGPSNSLGERTRAFVGALKKRGKNIAAGTVSGFLACNAVIFIP